MMMMMMMMMMTTMMTMMTMTMMMTMAVKKNTEDKGCLPFTWKTRKFQLENQMVRIIPLGVLLKLWTSGQSDAFLLLLLGFTADVHTFDMLSIFC